jgi:transcriptional regulator with XRE-family HTH domain
MSISKKLRSKTGLKIKDLAVIMDCSPSQITMAESKRRKLPGHAMGLINEIDNLLEQKEKSIASLFKADNENPKLIKMTKSNTLSLQRLELLQQSTQEKLYQTHHLIQLLELLTSAFQQDNGTYKAALIALNLRKAHEKYNQLLISIQIQETQIAGLKMSIRKAKRFVRI